MASTVIFQSFSSPIGSSVSASRVYRHNNKPRTLALYSSLLLPSKSFLKLKNKTLQPVVRSNKLGSRIYASQSNIFGALQTAYKTGKDAIEAGAVLVPDSIPRPIAKIAVALVGGSVAIFLLKSFLSTAFFVLAMMGLIYSAFIAFNKDKGPKGGGDADTTTSTTTSVDESLEEARRIMEKYK